MNPKEYYRRHHEKAKPAYAALMKFYPLTVENLDGNKLNNYVGNLEWATRSENNQHAKLASEQLAEQFGVSDTTIRLIQRGKVYKTAGSNTRSLMKAS